MDSKFLTVILSSMLLISTQALAENNAEFGIEDFQTETSVSSETTEKTLASHYVAELKLTPQQLEKAKAISADGRMKQEQIMKSLSLLKQQALEVEAQNLAEFEAILTPEQKEIFKKLRAGEK